MREISNFRKLKLSFWKNFFIQWNNRQCVFLSIILPILLGSILLLIREAVFVKFMPNAIFAETTPAAGFQLVLEAIRERRSMLMETLPQFKHNVFVPQEIIGYAPQQVEQFDRIMDKVQIALQPYDIRGFQTCSELRQAIARHSFFAGVCFQNTSSSGNVANSIYPKQLNFSLVFPGERRKYLGKHIGLHWITEMSHDFYDLLDDRIAYGANRLNEYFSEGFLHIQNEVSKSFIELVTNNELPSVGIQCLPYFAHYMDKLQHIYISLPLIVLIAFYYPIIFITRYRVKEKDNGVRFLLKLMGIHNWIQDSAWLLMQLITMLISSILFVLVFKISVRQPIAICSKSSVFALIIVLSSYNVAGISFCYMLSAFFWRPRSASTITGTIWFLTYVPYILLRNPQNSTTYLTWLLYFFPNSIMGLTFQNILDLEKFGGGYQLENVLMFSNEDDRANMGFYILLLYALAASYLFIGMYVESIYAGQYGEVKEWRNLYKAPVFSTPRNSANVEALVSPYAMKRPLIQLTNVSKLYEGKFAVKNVTLTFYQNEITALMGHNGCGKTTLMNIISGLLPPTDGTIIINGHNLHSDPELALFGLGVCTVLFNYLTVEDHLLYFAYIKGLTKSEARDETKKYLRAVNLEKERTHLTKHLVRSKQKLLVICCSLIGRSQFVLLNKPTMNMDLPSHNLFFELLQREKQGRTIILSTHTNEVPEAIADRVILMSNGVISSVGTTFFTKISYGFGRRLICIKSKTCQVEDITDVIARHIPNIVPESMVGNEVTYRIADASSQTVSNILNDVETLRSNGDLGINGYSISGPTLEDVLFENQHEAHAVSQTAFDKLMHSKLPKPLTGIQLLVGQFRALVWKRAVVAKYHIIHESVQFLLPMVIAMLAFSMANKNGTNILQPLSFNLDQYDTTVTVVDSKLAISDVAKRIHMEYIKLFSTVNQHHQVKGIVNNHVDKYLLETHAQHDNKDFYKYVVGATFKDESVVAWYNNFMIHSAPLSLNMINLAILRGLLPNEKGKLDINVHFEPLACEIKHNDYLHDHPLGPGNLLALLLSSVLTYASAHFVLFLVEERTTKMKLLQLISGASVFMLSLSRFCYHITWFVLVSFLTVLMLTINDNVQLAKRMDVMGWIFFILIIWGLSAITWNYLVGLMVYNKLTAYEIATCYHLLGIFYFYATVEIKYHYDSDNLHAFQILESLFWVIPTHSLCEAIAKIYAIDEIKSMCLDGNVRRISKIAHKCQRNPNCCDTHDVWSSPRGIAINVYYIVFMALIYLLIIFIIKNRNFLRSVFRRNLTVDDEKKEQSPREGIDFLKFEGDDVAQERVKVVNLRSHDMPPLVLNDVGKLHGGKLILDKLYLIGERATVTCLLGTNGSGKSMVTRLCIGEEALTCGHIKIESYDIGKEIKRAYRYIGYCTDYCMFLQDFTGYEMLHLVCSLRGLPHSYKAEYCKTMAQAFGFYHQLHKHLKFYSYGSRKRLCCAIAMLGQPSVILLDNASIGIDLIGSRVLWNMICQLRDKGVTFLTTTNYPQKCERIADKIAIIVDGKFYRIGTPWSINQRRMNSYKLQIKVQNLVWNLSSSEDIYSSRRLSRSLIVTNFIEREFQNSVLREENGNTLVFLIPQEFYTMSQIFTKIDANFALLNIEDFEIATGLLSLVFSELAETRRLLKERALESIV